MYTNTASLYCKPEANIMLYVNLPQSKKCFSIIYDMKYSSYASKKRHEILLYCHLESHPHTFSVFNNKEGGPPEIFPKGRSYDGRGKDLY